MEMTLRRLRKELGMSQERVAERMRVSRSLVGAWETGDRTPALDDAARLADVLGCSIDELVEGREPPWEGEEGELVALYRACTPDRRRTVMEVARGLADASAGDAASARGERRAV